MKKLILLAAPLCLAASAHAQVMVAGTSYNQDFDSLPNSGTPTWTDNSTLAGWFAKRASGAMSFTVANGSSNSGNFSSVGTTASTDRAMGSLQSGGTGVITFGVVLQNTSGTAWNGANIQLIGETWRRGTVQIPVDRLDFSTKVRADLTGFTITETGFNTNTAGDITTAAAPAAGAAGAYDGNLAVNRTASNFAITDFVNSGEFLILRWEDFNVANSDDLLAVDDFAFNANAVPEPASMTILAGAAAIAALRRRRK
ncbi:MAG: PEP-CTERM sorting domain-containing protein [Fimbriimonadaceae bacterium]